MINELEVWVTDNILFMSTYPLLRYDNQDDYANYEQSGVDSEINVYAFTVLHQLLPPFLIS